LGILNLFEIELVLQNLAYLLGSFGSLDVALSFYHLNHALHGLTHHLRDSLISQRILFNILGLLRVDLFFLFV
jgi:hypothetical protein